MTTQDLIRFLPMDEEYRKQLLVDYEAMDNTKKFQVDVLMWGAYDKLYDAQLEQNLKISWEKAGLGEEKLDKEFYKRVKKLTEQELAIEFTQTKDTSDLDEARKAMEVIIRQMKLAKEDKKKAKAAN